MYMHENGELKMVYEFSLIEVVKKSTSAFAQLQRDFLSYLVRLLPSLSHFIFTIFAAIFGYKIILIRIVYVNVL